jgi:predicted nucleic acid-binding protein
LIFYLDASAIVKRYIDETRSAEVRAATQSSATLGTSVLSRAEVAAAIHKGYRSRTIDEAAATEAVRRFERDWPSLVRLRVNEKLVKYAAGLAWTYGLRGYDSVHLASAAAWQQSLQIEVAMATFDLALWNAAGNIGLKAFPPDLPAWRKQRS